MYNDANVTNADVTLKKLSSPSKNRIFVMIFTFKILCMQKFVCSKVNLYT